jgi:hypothetical protein
MIYSESDGAGSISLSQQQQRRWAGRNLGVFQVGSEHIKVPIMIASPSTDQALKERM